jgi:hypothetical protein
LQGLNPSVAELVKKVSQRVVQQTRRWAERVDKSEVDPPRRDLMRFGPPCWLWRCLEVDIYHSDAARGIGIESQA